MVKMRSTVDDSEMDVSEEEAAQLQNAGKAYSVEDAEAKAKLAESGNYGSVTGRPDEAMGEAPKPVNAAGTPDQDNDEPPEPEEQPVKAKPSSSQASPSSSKPADRRR